MMKRKETTTTTADDEKVNMCFYETKYRKALWLPAQSSKRKALWLNVWEFVMTAINNRICHEIQNKRIVPVSGGPLYPLC